MSRVKHAFTLVELLVVIGIIALLISILLPSLARARQSAVLVADISNMRQVGQALQMYANENKGFLPYGSVKDHNNWHEVVTDILGQADPNNARKRAKVLYSTGIPMDSNTEPYYWWTAWTWNAFDERASYMCNPRLMPFASKDDLDTANGRSAQAFRRQFSDVKNPAAKLLIWDGGIVGWNNLSAPFMSPWYMDGWRWFWGHKFCDPPADGTGTWENLDIPMDLGELNTSSDLARMKREENVDSGGGFCTTDRQPFWNGMRFRHMGNTTGAFMYVDGHVEARKIGEVTKREVCVNFK